MPYPSQGFATPQELLNYINSMIVTNGVGAITAVKHNNVENGLANLTLASVLNFNSARIISTGGNVTLDSPFNVVTNTLPTSLKWIATFHKEFYVINTTAFDIPLADGFSYYDAFAGMVTAIPANSSIHIVLATNGNWIQFYNPTGDVIITNPILITTQPQTQTKVQGQSVTFTSAATGGVGTLTPQWRFNTVNISGANSTSLTISSVQPYNAGSYDVIYTDELSNVKISNAAVLTVNALGLYHVYVGIKAEDEPGNPTEFEIVTGNLSMQDTSGNVTANWVPFIGAPRYLWVAIESAGIASNKNHWADDSFPINNGPIAGTDGSNLFDEMEIVSVGGVDYYVTVTNYKTEVGGPQATFTLSKI